MNVDVAVIGGGYYGCVAAIEIARTRPDLRVAVFERGPQLFGRASSTNQGQLHAGYMYSKFPELAGECAEGAREFRRGYGEAVNEDVRTYYGVHRDSEIGAAEYAAFCKATQLPLAPVREPTPDFFGAALVQVYETAEKTFDNARLQALLTTRLAAAKVKVVTSFAAKRVERVDEELAITGGSSRTVRARAVFNATFADSNELHGRSGLPSLPLDHAVFLHFLVDLPDKFARQGVIVVRGQYAALTPASAGLGASHVLASGQFRLLRTSHLEAPSEAVDAQEVTTRYEQARAEAVGYLPALERAKLVGHTIGTRTNYTNPATGKAESRAVVLPDYAGWRGYHCVFGGKVTCLPEIVAPVRELANLI